MPRRSRLAALRSDRTLGAVVGVTALALLARLAWLGSRVAHQDEGRVGYWTVRYLVSGRYEYRPIVHGPFLPVVNRHVFSVLGPSDVSARLVVALLGALLPLAALLFRERLRDSEVVAMALLLAANPVLLYYSRFMRTDLPLAAFMLFAVGLFVRAIDADGRRSRRRYLAAGVAAMAVGFTTKENALLYVLTWVGAGALLLDHRLFRARPRGTTPWGVITGTLPSPERAKALARAWALPAVALVLEFLVIVVVFYAPRGGGYPAPAGSAGGMGLWESIVAVDPGAFLSVVGEATLGTWREFYGTWAAGGHQDHPYIPFLIDFLKTMGAGALSLSVLSVLGFVADRYAEGGPRDAVAFAGYWGFVSVLGYPIVTDIAAPWTTIHAIVPLTIPAAVGLALVYRHGQAALDDRDGPAVAAAAILLVLVAAQVSVAAAGAVYLNPQSQDNELVQYAQSSSTDLKPVLADVETAARGNNGVDVLFYGDEFDSPDESAHDQPLAGPGWFARLPLSWYFETSRYEFAREGAVFNVSSTTDHRDLTEDPPPVVISLSNLPGRGVGHDADDVAPYLEGYLRYRGHRYLYDTGTISSITIFVDPALVDDPAAAYDGSVVDPGEPPSATRRTTSAFADGQVIPGNGNGTDDGEAIPGDGNGIGDSRVPREDGR